MSRIDELLGFYAIRICRRRELATNVHQPVEREPDHNFKQPITRGHYRRCGHGSTQFHIARVRWLLGA